MKFDVKDGRGAAPAVDWQAVKEEILSRLDIAAEYRALGVRLARTQPNARGIIPAHAIDREDAEPSAMINVRTGIYHDSGGTGESSNLWDFTQKHGPGFGRHIDVVRHYAEKAGVELPSVTFSSKGRIREATYLYHDERDQVAFAVFRYRLPDGKKSFSQHPPDGRGGWTYGPGCMVGVKLYPYRLPELLGADPELPVWLVEGERDVERLRSLGADFPATCNPMGAGKWRDEFSAWLADRVCYILPDNDPAGRKHALEVAASLHGRARVVKVIELPGLPPKGDVSDWLDAGGTVEELGRLAYEAGVWNPEAGPKEEPRRWACLADVRRVQANAAWLWEGWIPAAHIAGIAAFEGVGKSRFALDLCRRAYLGLPWPDGKDATLPVGSRSIWVCSDANQDELTRFAPAFGLPDEAIYFPAPPDDPYEGTDIDSAETMEAIEQAIADIRPAFVFIDTLTSATQRDLCSQQSVKPLKAALFHLAQTYQTSIILLLHVSKEGHALGRRIKGVTRVLMQMECPSPDQPECLKLRVEKSCDKRPRPLRVTMGDNGNEYETAAPGAGRPPAERDQAQQFILDAVTRRNDYPVMGLMTEFIAQGGSERTFWRARDTLVATGVLTCDGRPKVLTLVNHAPMNGAPY